MPISGFRWLKEEEIELLDFETMTLEQSDGFILEVDLYYPSKLHDAHNSFPLAPERLIITKDQLSPYALGNSLICPIFF